MMRLIWSALWWAVTLTTTVVTVAATVILISHAPDWSIYRSGGVNPVVHMPE